MVAERTWLLPAEGRSIVQWWHDAGTFDQQRRRPGNIVDPRRDWLLPAEGRPTVQEWHGARKISSGRVGSETTTKTDNQEETSGESGRQHRNIYVAVYIVISVTSVARLMYNSTWPCWS
jgi:hypothetical protein